MDRPKEGPAGGDQNRRDERIAGDVAAQHRADLVERLYSLALRIGKKLDRGLPNPGLARQHEENEERKERPDEQDGVEGTESAQQNVRTRLGILDGVDRGDALRRAADRGHLLIDVGQFAIDGVGVRFRTAL